MATRLAHHDIGTAVGPPIELLPPELVPLELLPPELVPPDPVRTGMQVADIERTTTVGRWFDDVIGRCGEWATPASGRGMRCQALPTTSPAPGPRRQELQVFRQVWLPVEQVVSYLAAAPAQPSGRCRPRLECSFAELRRPPDRAIWTAEGYLRPRWSPGGIRVRISLFGLAGPRTVLDLVPVVTRKRLRSRRFARAGIGVLEALREEIRQVLPEQVPPSPAATPRPGLT